MNCDDKDNVTETATADGKRVIAICRQRIAMNAVSGLRSARAQIVQEPGMPEHARAEALRSIDREIERMEKGE